MKFTIITHVPHVLENKQYYAYGPYVNEMNLWLKHVDEVIVCAPVSSTLRNPIDCAYEQENLNLVTLQDFDIKSLSGIVKTVLKIPKNMLHIYRAMKRADHIHLRCPGNMGLLGCIVQILFPKKPKTAKYAGNWDPNSTQPLSYRLQKWILSNTFLTRNMKVLVYGEWAGQTANIYPFFTATYSEADKQPIIEKNLGGKIKCLFVGTLSEGKRPLYAAELVASLLQSGYDVTLDYYGEGDQKIILENYSTAHNLERQIRLHGNQPKAIIEHAYREAHFLILPSKSEGWPKVVAEAMFWGCLPVATSVSCVPFMLNHGNRGILLTLSLKRDKARLQDYLSNPALYRQQALSASEWSRKYTTDFFEQEIKVLLHP